MRYNNIKQKVVPRQWRPFDFDYDFSLRPKKEQQRDLLAALHSRSFHFFKKNRKFGSLTHSLSLWMQLALTGPVPLDFA